MLIYSQYRALTSVTLSISLCNPPSTNMVSSAYCLLVSLLPFIEIHLLVLSTASLKMCSEYTLNKRGYNKQRCPTHRNILVLYVQLKFILSTVIWFQYRLEITFKSFWHIPIFSSKSEPKTQSKEDYNFLYALNLCHCPDLKLFTIDLRVVQEVPKSQCLLCNLSSQ